MLDVIEAKSIMSSLSPVALSGSTTGSIEESVANASSSSLAVVGVGRGLDSADEPDMGDGSSLDFGVVSA